MKLPSVGADFGVSVRSHSLRSKSASFSLEEKGRNDDLREEGRIDKQRKNARRSFECSCFAMERRSDEWSAIRRENPLLSDDDVNSFLIAVATLFAFLLFFSNCRFNYPR